MPHFSKEARTEAVKLFLLSGQVYRVFQTKWESKFGKNQRKPSHSGILKMVQKFLRTGSVNNSTGSGRKRTARSDENIFNAAISITEKPDLSLGDLKYHFDVSKTSLWRILRHDLQWRPYKSRRVHKLQDGDTMFRRAYCRNMLQILSTKPDFLNYI